MTSGWHAGLRAGLLQIVVIPVSVYSTQVASGPGE